MSAATNRSGSRHPIAVGTSVSVRTRFDGRWSAGFEVADLLDTDSDYIKYQLRRSTDGAILPVLFPDVDVTPSGPRWGAD
jgi:hypothetical protein